MQALTKHQRAELIHILKGILGKGTNTVVVDPKFHEFIDGEKDVLKIGIFQLKRNKDNVNLFDLSMPEQKPGQTEQIRIGAVTVFITGSAIIQFFISTHK